MRGIRSDREPIEIKADNTVLFAKTMVVETKIVHSPMNPNSVQRLLITTATLVPGQRVPMGSKSLVNLVLDRDGVHFQVSDAEVIAVDIGEETMFRGTSQTTAGDVSVKETEQETVPFLRLIANGGVYDCLQAAGQDVLAE